MFHIELKISHHKKIKFHLKTDITTSYNAIRNKQFAIIPKSIYNKQKEILKIIISLIKPIEFDKFKKLLIMRLITPISMDIMEEQDRKSVDDLIRIIYISEYDTIIKKY